MVKTMTRKALTGILSGILATLIVWLLVLTPPFASTLYRFEAASYDWRMTSTIDPPEINKPIDEVVIVDIDGRSLAAMGPFQQWPRTHWAKVVNRLQDAGVRKIGIDVIFDPSIRFPEEDATFIEAVKKSQRVVAAVVFSRADDDQFLRPMPVEPEGLDVGRFTIKISSQLRQRLQTFNYMEPDFVTFLNAASTFGAVNLVPDRDGVSRHIPLFVRFNENVYPTFAFAMVLKDIGAESIDLAADQRSIIITTDSKQSLTIPVDDQCRMLIHFHGYFRSFRYISFYDLYQGGVAPEFLADKMVLFGSSAPGLNDLRSTPWQASFPGVEVHANIIHQLLSRDFIDRPDGSSRFIMLLLTGVVAGVSFSLLRPGWGVFLMIGLAVGILFYASWMFATEKLWLPLVAPQLVLLLTFAILNAWRFKHEAEDKLMVQNMFSHYVSPKVVDRLVRDPSRLRLGGEKLSCTVFFSDIVGFTSISEATPPEELVMLLNEYLTEMTHIIIENQGMLDKYGGDSIMALFGVPLEIENHALAACHTALKMQRRLAGLRHDFRKRGLPEMHQRIGINTGQMVVGNMGSSDHQRNYTAIGDAVNLGARLESANKIYDSNILISEDTRNMAGDGIIIRNLDRIRVKGRHQPVNIFELIALADDPIDHQTREALNLFQEAYQAYLERDWEQARKRLGQVLALRPEDGPTHLYLRRCKQFEKEPPPDNWDGIFTADSK